MTKDTYGKHGPIQYRTTIKSLLFKKWSHGYWLHVLPAKIYIFKSLSDLEQWKELHDTSLLLCHSRLMNRLVRAYINFDTTNAFSTSSNQTEFSTSSNQTDHNFNCVNSSNGGIPVTYIMELVRSKCYQKKEKLM